MMNDQPPTWLRRMCAHGKSLDQECLACAMMDKIDLRRDARIRELESENARLRAMLESLPDGVVAAMDVGEGEGEP